MVDVFGAKWGFLAQTGSKQAEIQEFCLPVS
jgi:hypothetical protein